jgi:hypothetical protein
VRILPHWGRGYVGSGRDPQIFIWSFEWWPHAILHGDNPFYTHAVWAPDGLNLAWVTSVPGLALPLAPLTLLFGPVAAYNVAAVLMPALAAWAAYLLCRHVTGAIWPSLVGGYLFGFSSYMLGQQLGHMHMAAVFPIPLVALTILRAVEGELTARALVLRLGLLLALQISFSTELFFTLTLAVATALTVALVLVRSIRARVRALLAPLAGAYAFATLLVSPLLVYAATGFESKSINPPELYPADLLNFVVPTGILAVGNRWTNDLSGHFLGNISESGAYLGLPTLLAVAWFARVRWRSPGGRFLLVALGIAALAALGASLHVDGHRVAPLPWRLLSDLPLFDNILPVRLSLFVSLAAAVIVAIWAASNQRPAFLGLLVPALAVLFLVPDLRVGHWKATPRRPSFFADALYRTYLQPNENVLVVPYGGRGDAMLWQAESEFYFRMPGGYIRPDIPDSFARFRAVRDLVYDVVPEGGARDLLALIRAKDVRAIILAKRDSRSWRPVLCAIGRPRAVGGILLYGRIDGGRSVQARSVSASASRPDHGTRAARSVHGRARSRSNVSRASASSGSASSTRPSPASHSPCSSSVTAR